MILGRISRELSRLSAGHGRKLQDLGSSGTFVIFSSSLFLTRGDTRGFATALDDLPLKLGKLLVANRGEIACRVLSSARRLGIPTVAVYSEADNAALHVSYADEAVNIGPAAARDSYLRSDTILDIAKKMGVKAIHPGYGFLSENAEFAEQCEAFGITFVGPPSSAIRSMGDKKQAKEVMSAAGVAVVPGYHGEDQSLDRLQAEANKIGFPLLVKAVMGGGGKGMKLARSSAEVRDAVQSAQREAAASFNDHRVLLERFIEVPRHVEVQVFADSYGDTVYLFERDCSIQRRHQKIIEEAPAPGVSEEFRRQIGSSAVAAAKAVDYRSAGTVEFIMDTLTGEYFFMEMNTRLQVEHPVTEMITGLDLVGLQLEVAAGHRLPFKQEDLHIQGHAIEARLYAENPAKGFLPASGTVAMWATPQDSCSFSLDRPVRVDSGVQQGDEVGINYDPMIAKVIAHGPDRSTAIQRLSTALGQLQVAGIPNNVPFVGTLLQHPAFLSASLNTNFIEDHKASLEALLHHLPRQVVALAALSRLLELEQRDHAGKTGPGRGAWLENSNMRLNGLPVVTTMELLHTAGGTCHSVSASVRDGNMELSVEHPDGRDAATWMCTVKGARLQEGGLTAEIGGQRESALAVWLPHTGTDSGDTVDLWWRGRHYQLALPLRESSEATAGGNTVVSPMPGKVLRVTVEEGQGVKAGDPVAVLEAMKMEHTLRAEMDGVIANLNCAAGAQVQDGHVLATITNGDATAPGEH